MHPFHATSLVADSGAAAMFGFLIYICRRPQEPNMMPWMQQLRSNWSNTCINKCGHTFFSLSIRTEVSCVSNESAHKGRRTAML